MNSSSSKVSPQQEYNIMIDLETLGVIPGCVILSLAAVEFELNTGKIGRYFYENISIESSLEENFKIEEESWRWWSEQDNDVKKEIVTNPKPLKIVLEGLDRFLNDINPDRKSIRVWGNGSSFDLGILSFAYFQLRMKIPWMFWAERDLRTIVAFAPDIKKRTDFVGKRHHPLYDCLHQIKYCSKIYSLISVAKE